MTDEPLVTCPYCGAEVPTGQTVCQQCHEDLAALVQLRYAHAIEYNSALALAREGRLDEARARVRIALQQRESFAPAHVLAAKIAAQQERWSEARASIQRARELRPDEPHLAELGGEIERAATEAEQQQRDEMVAQMRGLRDTSSSGKHHLIPGHWFGAYQRDVVKAFGLGVGITTILAVLISRLARHR